MITPLPLQKGQKVAIVAPAKSIGEHDVDKAVEIFTAWGLEVVLGRYLFSSFHQFAGKDHQRAADLQKAINDPQIKAVFCVRGGYGTARIIERLDFNPLRKSPKWVVGFSDVTVMLSQLYNLGMESIHGIMPALFAREGTDRSIESLRKILFGLEDTYFVNPHPLNRPGTAEGRLTGGNLSILCHSIGTDADLVTDGTILFLEDVDEHLYRIDRMLVQLKQAGRLENLSGLIVGHFTDMKDEKDVPFGKSAVEIILEHVSEYGYPVCFGFPAGHHPHNLALPISRHCTLNVDKFGGILNLPRPENSNSF